MDKISNRALFLKCRWNEFFNEVFCMLPNLNGHTTSLIRGKKAFVVLFGNLYNARLRIGDNTSFPFRNRKVIDTPGNTRHSRVPETKVFYFIEKRRNSRDAIAG